MRTLLRRRGLRYPILILLIILLVPACGGDAEDGTTVAPASEVPPIGATTSVAPEPTLATTFTTTVAPVTTSEPTLVLSDDPPYGLTEIDLPETSEELIAAFERMPAIDGHQPTLTVEEGSVILVYEGAALPADYLSMWVILDLEVTLDLEVDGESWTDGLKQDVENPEREGWILDGSALDPNSDLVWLADHWMADYGAEGELPVFQMIWFDPSDLGPSYSVFGNTADFRRKLVQAFINAATE